MCDYAAEITTKALSNCVEMYSCSAFPKGAEQGTDTNSFA